MSSPLPTGYWTIEFKACFSFESCFMWMEIATPRNLRPINPCQLGKQSLFLNHMLFLQVQNCQTKGALGVIVSGGQFQALEDMNCQGSECNVQLNIPATMIPFDTAFKMRGSNHSYVRFQTTPSDVFAFGIDGQGKVQETGWFLYPSMRFLAYQAQWWVSILYSFCNDSVKRRQRCHHPVKVAFEFWTFPFGHKTSDEKLSGVI